MPTVCKITLDATEYRKELEAVVAESRAAAGRMSALEGKGVAVRAKVEGDALESLAPKIAAVEKQAKKTSSVFGKLVPQSLKAKAASVFGAVRKEMNDTSGGVKEFFSKFLAGGGAVGIIVAGIASIGKIAKTAYDGWIGRMKDAGEMAQRNAESIREAAAANEQLRQKSFGYLSQLQSLSSQETLSNANKAEARKLIAELTKSYGELGVALDETTGKLTGVDSAIIRKVERDKSRRIQELEAEREQLMADQEAQERIRDRAGMPIWPGGWRLGGKEAAEEAGKKIEEIGKRRMEVMRELHRIRGEDQAGDIRAKRSAELEDLSRSHQDQLEAFGLRQADDAFSGEGDVAARIANRQALIDRHRQERILPLEEKVEAARKKAEDWSAADSVEAERNLIQLQKELQAELEKAYAWERQIEEIKKQQADSYAKLLDQSRFELDYNALILAGEHDKAAALKMEKELRDQNLKLAAAETEELARQQAALAAQNLERDQRDKAYDLYGKAMEKAGLGREYAERKALMEARAVKGRELTGEEAELVRKLAELSWALDNRREAKYGDMSISSNSLTARGGFQGGAKAPDSDRINREIASTSKSMLQVLQRIEAVNRELGVFR